MSELRFATIGSKSVAMIGGAITADLPPLATLRIHESALGVTVDSTGTG